MTITRLTPDIAYALAYTEVGTGSFGSTRSCGRDLFSFSCTARASDRRFVVPARILSALPPTTSFFGLSNGALNISTTTPGGLRRFTAPGLDLGLFLQLSISAIRPTYE